MSVNPKIPLPLEPIKSNTVEDRRLWVGNLDLRINEYQLLKILQKYGEIEKFDLLFHRSGPQAGQPRGYAFVTYTTVDAAEKAKNILHNAKLGSKCVVLRWAHSVTESDMEKPKPKLEITALAGAKKEEDQSSRQTTIQAIEAKLKLMEERKDDFDLNKPLLGIPTSQLEENNKKPSSSNRHHYNHYRHYRNRPYSRSRPRR